MTKTVFINGRFLTQPVTGVQRYSISLLDALDQILPEKDLLNFVCLVPHEETIPVAWRHIEVKKVGKLAGNLWEQRELPFHASNRLLFSPANIGPWNYKNQAIIFYDASVFAVPESYTLSFRMKYSLIMRALAKRAKSIITISTFSQGELSRFLSIPKSRLNVVSAGADHFNALSADRSVLDKNSLEPGRFLLAVGSQNYHKNLLIVLHLAASMLDMQFVIVGMRFAKVFAGTSVPTETENVKRLASVSDSQLKSLYENAAAFIFPSRYEGFGLPVLEAMSSGCPVISSNAASLPEVAGEAALYFDPSSDVQLRAQVMSLLTNSSLRGKMVDQGYRRAGMFKWENVAREIYRILLGVA